MQWLDDIRVIPIGKWWIRKLHLERIPEERLGFPASCGHVNHVTQPA